MPNKTSANFFTSKAATETMLWLGRSIPPSIGLPLSRIIADVISSQKMIGPVKAVRANQKVIQGGQVPDDQLDQLVKETYRHAARCLYEYYNALNNPQAMLKVVFSSEMQALMEKMKEGKQGWICVAPHMGNFDLIGRAIAAQQVNFLVLSVANPTDGYQIQNELRARSGIEMAPASMDSLRKATERLRNKGVVLTAADRPFKDSHYRPRFFGHPASLPVVHIKLALRFGLPVYVIGGFCRDDDRVEVFASEPIPMQKSNNPEEEVIMNAEAVLQSMEHYIRAHPTQWNMSFPVWDDV